MQRSLVGSEMCIRDRLWIGLLKRPVPDAQVRSGPVRSSVRDRSGSRDRQNIDKSPCPFSFVRSFVRPFGCKTFGRTKKIRTKNFGQKKFRQNIFDKIFGRKLLAPFDVRGAPPTKKKRREILVTGEKSWSPTEILVAGENLGRRRKSWSPAKILVADENLGQRRTPDPTTWGCLGGKPPQPTRGVWGQQPPR